MDISGPNNPSGGKVTFSIQNNNKNLLPEDSLHDKSTITINDVQLVLAHGEQTI